MPHCGSCPNADIQKIIHEHRQKHTIERLVTRAYGKGWSTCLVSRGAKLLLFLLWGQKTNWGLDISTCPQHQLTHSAICGGYLDLWRVLYWAVFSSFCQHLQRLSDKLPSYSTLYCIVQREPDFRHLKETKNLLETSGSLLLASSLGLSIVTRQSDFTHSSSWEPLSLTDPRGPTTPWFL